MALSGRGSNEYGARAVALHRVRRDVLVNLGLPARAAIAINELFAVGEKHAPARAHRCVAGR